MNNYINQVTHLDCPLCDSKLTLRRNNKAHTLFLGCQTYQTTKCVGSTPLTDDVIIEVRKHFLSLNAPRQMSLLDKGHRKVYITVRYEVFDGADEGFDDLLSAGNAELSFDNLVDNPAVMTGSSIFAELLQKAIDEAAL